MRKYVSILLASTVTVAGPLAGVTPAHAITKPAEFYIGQAYDYRHFVGDAHLLVAKVECARISRNQAAAATSAVNRSTSSVITFYQSYIPFVGCVSPVTVLYPGEKDNGYIVGTGELSELGRRGAAFYGST